MGIPANVAVSEQVYVTHPSCGGFVQRHGCAVPEALQENMGSLLITRRLVVVVVWKAI